MKYTIKSVSDEGIYYLVRAWMKNHMIWTPFVDNNFCFKTEKAAKTALTRLLSVMEEYSEDEFYVVAVKDNKVVNEQLYKRAA